MCVFSSAVVSPQPQQATAAGIEPARNATHTVASTSSSGSTWTTITGLQTRSTQNTTSSSIQSAANKATQPAANNSTQPSTSKATQPAASNSTQPSTSNSIQSAAVKATQPAVNNSTQPCTSNSIQSAADKASQPAANNSTRPSTSKATQPVAGNVTQPALSNNATQPAANSTTTAAAAVTISSSSSLQSRVMTSTPATKSAPKFSVGTLSGDENVRVTEEDLEVLGLDDEVSAISYHKFSDMDRPTVSARPRKSKITAETSNNPRSLLRENGRNVEEGGGSQILRTIVASPAVKERKSTLVGNNCAKSSRGRLLEESGRNAGGQGKDQPKPSGSQLLEESGRAVSEVGRGRPKERMVAGKNARTVEERGRSRPPEAVAASPGVRQSYRNSQKFAKMALLDVNVDAKERNDSSVYDLAGATQSGDSSSESLVHVETDRSSRTNVGKQPEKNVKNLALSSQLVSGKTVGTNGRETVGKPRVQGGSRKAVSKQSKKDTVSSDSAVGSKQPRALPAFGDDCENEENLLSIEKLRNAVRQRGRRGSEKEKEQLLMVAAKKPAASAASVSTGSTKSESLPNKITTDESAKDQDRKDMKKPRKKMVKSSSPAVSMATGTLERRASSRGVEVNEKVTRQMVGRNPNRSASQKRSSKADAAPSSPNLRSRSATRQTERAKSPEPADTTQSDVEPDSPVKRRKSSTPESAGTTPVASDIAGRAPVPQSVESDGVNRSKKSRHRPQPITFRGSQKRTKAVSGGKKSAKGQLAWICRSVILWCSCVSSFNR